MWNCRKLSHIDTKRNEPRITWRLRSSFTKVLYYFQAINKIVLEMREETGSWMCWYDTWRLMVCDKVQVHTSCTGWHWWVKVTIIIVLSGSENKYLLFAVTVGKKGYTVGFSWGISAVLTRHIMKTSYSSISSCQVIRSKWDSKWYCRQYCWKYQPSELRISSK